MLQRGSLTQATAPITKAAGHLGRSLLRRYTHHGGAIDSIRALEAVEIGFALTTALRLPNGKRLDALRNDKLDRSLVRLESLFAAHHHAKETRAFLSSLAFFTASCFSCARMREWTQVWGPIHRPHLILLQNKIGWCYLGQGSPRKGLDAARWGPETVNWRGRLWILRYRDSDPVELLC